MEPNPSCDHSFVSTYMRYGRFIKRCQCGLVVSTDFGAPPAGEQAMFDSWVAELQENNRHV